jgi:hypothetical protein
MRGKEAAMFRIGKEAVALSRAQRIGALYRIIPREKVKRILRTTGRDRAFCARLPALFVVYFLLAMGLFCNDCYRQIFRWLRPWRKGSVPGRSMLCQARRRLGLTPLAALARETVKLLGKPQTPGVFYRGLRMMALDGLVVDIPDLPANDKAFGRPAGSRAPGAFPQVRVVVPARGLSIYLARRLLQFSPCPPARLAPIF